MDEETRTMKIETRPEIAAQMLKCLRGEHEAGDWLSNAVGMDFCKHCRCLYIKVE